MSITINTNVIRTVPQVNDAGLALVILKYAREIGATTEAPIRVNNYTELEAAYELPTTTPTTVQTKSARRELAVVEYMLSQSVNLILLSTETIGTIADADLLKVAEVDDLGYRIILVPYDLQTDTTVATKMIAFVADKDVELFLDIDPTLTTTNIEDARDDVKVAISEAGTEAAYSGKVSLFLNMGLPNNYVSSFNDATYNMTAYMDADADLVYWYGIPLSAVVAARKSSLLISNTPWFPVAGEKHGLIPEFNSIYVTYLSSEKITIQALDINLAINKAGLGIVIVSQNTLARVSTDDTDKTNPLIRGHVITQALYIKRYMKVITESIMFAPHITKTYNNWELKVNHFMEDIKGGDGITYYQVVTGPKVMSAADVAAGIFRGTLSYHPINVIESAIITLNILETEDSGVLVEGV